MKRKILFIPLVLITAAAGLFAGGQKASQSASLGTSPNAVSLWYWDDLVTRDYLTLAREFEQAYSGNKLTLSLIPQDDYWTKLRTALSGGAGPDVFWLNYPHAASYMSSENVMELESWAADINFSNFNERFYKPYTYQGKRYAVPFMWDSVVLFYNKAAFDTAGIDYPNENWTWDDFYNAARGLTIDNGNTITQYGVLVSGSMQSGAGPFIYQNEGSIYNSDGTRMTLNTPQAREAVQLQLDMINDGCSPTAQMTADNSAVNLFTSGLVAMMPFRSYWLSYFAENLKQKLRVAPLPRQQCQATIYNNLAYAAAAKTDNPGATRKLMSFLASRRAAEIISNTFAPCYDGVFGLFFDKYQWAGAHYIPESLNYALPLPIPSKNAGELWNLVESKMFDIYSEAGTLDTQLADLEDLVNEDLTR